MNLLIAPDKFKGSATAAEIAQAIAKGWQTVRPDDEIRCLPLADGGDGSLAVLSELLQLKTASVNTQDPLGRPLQASYAWSDKTAYVELAAASGIVLLSQAELNPWLTSTYGTGLLLKDAIARGCRDIYLLLGGSATNDLGFGIARALGFRFYDQSGQDLAATGGNLQAIASIAPPDQALPSNLRIRLLCDVTNPLYGPQGAAHIYAPQKGADTQMVKRLDDGLRSSSAILEHTTGRSIRSLAGGGAAGGVAAGLHALLGAEIQGGFSTISQLLELEAAVEWADLVISGEGKLDEQSLAGKVIDGVNQLCQQHNKPLQLVVGQTDLEQLQGIHAIWATAKRAKNAADSMANVRSYLEDIGSAMSSGIQG